MTSIELRIRERLYPYRECIPNSPYQFIDFYNLAESRLLFIAARRQPGDLIDIERSGAARAGCARVKIFKISSP